MSFPRIEATATRRKSCRANALAMPAAIAAPPDSATHARAAGLRYATDAAPGIRRVRKGRGFAYVRPDGRPVRDAEEKLRIAALAIPPAWTDVWISPDPHGHLQATGRDARGRKQYRYHERWREVRDETKFGRMLRFGRALPKLRARVRRDLRRADLPREKVVAMVVRLLETTLARVGNDEYARSNGSRGLTTLEDRHARIEGGKLRLRFRGKGGKAHDVEVDDTRLSRIARKCRDLPGQELFQYLDEEGEPRPIGSEDVNAYIRDATGEDFTAKDFRTWAGTILAAIALARLGPAASTAQRKRSAARAIEAVASVLGNTPAVCRKAYVHPRVLGLYLDGDFSDAWQELVGESDPDDLGACERAMLRLLAEAREPPARPAHRRRAPRRRRARRPRL